MSDYNKKISPQAVLALKEALSVICWRKEDLQDFIKLSINNTAIIGTINWSGTKRESVKELIERMTNRQDIYKDDLISLISSVTDLTEFSQLEYWDTDGSLKKKAIHAVQNLRNHTEGYIQITREQEESRKRKLDVEKRIAKNKSLDDELSLLKERFNKIASNPNLQKRGYEFESFLRDLFTLFELDPKGSFKNYGEQIDGAFTFDGTDYLLEAKWKQQVDRGELASFCFKVDSKFKISIGLLVTMEGLTPQAIAPEFKSIIIMDSIDLIAVLDGRVRLPDLLYRKRRKATETGKIYVNFYEL
ncbi:MAG: hypothetical protein BWX62_00957 [Bacteroidetes bacterium ADurb.Bin037]|nr:MAG: hypothetical protein BWX62_00957 [Bacteroidetes bacterium ADurb.Bin037]HPW77772.1 hypothetical protein [Bacteroidales bacterium]HQB55599.1 hypothetical protein [Bacteroidales bacterium]